MLILTSETTLDARNFARILRDCKTNSYTVNLIYFELQTPELAICRVKRRVESGGHNIPEEVIRRRYSLGRKNLSELYLPLCDTRIIYDNSRNNPELIAERPLNQESIIYQPFIWQQITESIHE